MTGAVKLVTAGSGAVNLQPASSIASDVTVQVPSVDSTLVYANSSGNVGIGTSSPTERLGVLSDLTGTTAGSNVVARFQSNGNGRDANLSLGDNVNASARLGYLSGNMYFWTNGSERMRIDSSGNLLVGTTSATGGNGTTGKVHFRNDSGAPLLCSNESGSGTLIQFSGNGGGVASGNRITHNGSSVTYGTTSDYRLKENIQPMQNALGVVAQLNPVTYTWKADGSDGQGFIAHELQAVVPDCVTGEKDAVDTEGNPVYQGIDTSFLVATLTKAIQELKEQVDAQAAEIATLKGNA